MCSPAGESFSYFQVTLKPPGTISFLKAKHSQSIGDALLELLNDDIIINKIISSKTPLATDGIDTTASTPVQVLVEFGTKYLFIETGKQTDEKIEEKTDKQNAFAILMNATKKYNCLPQPRPPNNNKDKVYNEVLKLMENSHVGFTSQQVETTGVAVTKVLANALWYMDPHHDKFTSRGILIPESFRRISNFNNWKLQKKKEPQITSSDLELHVGALCDMIMMPWFLNDTFQNFKNLCSDLIEGLKKYLRHLKQQQDRTAAIHATPKSVRSITDSWTCGVIEAGQAATKPEYLELQRDLDVLNLYEPLFLFDYEPKDRYERRKWIQEINLAYPVRLYQHHHGNYFGNFNFLWKIAPALEERGDGDLGAIDKIREDLFTFSTRAIRKDFIDRYSKVNVLKPAILRDVYRFLTQDSSAAETTAQSEVDSRVAEFLLDADDSALFYDLRIKNGRPKDKKLDPFWEALDRYLEDVAVVHERRQGEVMYMPIAMLMQHLIDEVSKTLPKDASLPSVSWLRLNFWPSNAYTQAAMCYTGRYKIRYAVQQRLLRSKHPDSNFAFNQFKLMKDMAVNMRDQSNMICLDDKAVVPVGEPDAPISTGVRSQTRALVPVGVKLAALDHDFHVHGVVPSVLFKVNIPTDSKDSFYNGDIHVSVKNKVFEPSSAVRHMTETNSILRSTAAEGDGISLDKSVLFVYTDGGPDHRSTFWTVQIAFIALFIHMDLDLLVAIRTAPSHSYCNPAERCMSLLNMALQNASLASEKMDDTAEFQVKSLSTMKQLRQTSEKQPILKEALISSMEPVIAKLKL